uniref:DUF834 domain-containing protein n=1 Tax=Oryza brachyantha TaxID=4533 RepID=J3LP95_ORYBR
MHVVADREPAADAPVSPDQQHHQLAQLAGATPSPTMPPARRSPGGHTDAPQAALDRPVPGGAGIGGGRAFGDVDGASGAAVVGADDGAGAAAASAFIDVVLDCDKEMHGGGPAHREPRCSPTRRPTTAAAAPPRRS